MQKKIMPLEEKLANDGRQSYTVQSAMELLGEKIAEMKISDMAEDLLPMFEQRSFTEAWLEGFRENFSEYVKSYFLKSHASHTNDKSINITAKGWEQGEPIEPVWPCDESNKRWQCVSG